MDVAIGSPEVRLFVPFRGWVADHPRLHPVVRLGYPAVNGWRESQGERSAIQEPVWARALGVERDVVIERVEFDDDVDDLQWQFFN
jgi:hypothetical protein